MLSSGWLVSYVGQSVVACINNYSLRSICSTVTVFSSSRILEGFNSVAASVEALLNFFFAFFKTTFFCLFFLCQPLVMNNMKWGAFFF